MNFNFNSLIPGKPCIPQSPHFPHNHGPSGPCPGPFRPRRRRCRGHHHNPHHHCGPRPWGPAGPCPGPRPQHPVCDIRPKPKCGTSGPVRGGICGNTDGTPGNKVVGGKEVLEFLNPITGIGNPLVATKKLGDAIGKLFGKK